MHIASSTRGAESATRELANELVENLSDGETTVTNRDLAESIPLLSPAATADLTVPVGERSPEAAADLAVSDQLIEELVAADLLVFGVPIYNFGVPASLKAWADLVARSGITFAYKETGLVGLLSDRPTFIVSASGGTEIGGDDDYGTGWLQFFLGFLGIKDVTTIAASSLNFDAEASLASARSQIVEASRLPARQ